ncbi:hypothetical protein ACIA8G_30035 [Lentzea sp. NPDC051213]|uniref:hypothetical protein n=1 Tax=Lentzea sp. NPDC051213 TaxID=3364126 RepID=UPI0037989513
MKTLDIGRRTSRTLTVLVVAALGLATATISTVVAPATAHASTAGGQITRSEVLQRARHWYAQDPARYDGPDTSQWLADIEGDHTYRRDCSGLVSMALHLTSSPSSFSLATSTYGVPINWQDLRPGDYLTVDDGVVGDWQDGHVVLFEGWAPAYPKFDYYGFGGTDGQRNSLRHRIGDFSGAAVTTAYGDDGKNGAGVLDGHATSKYKAFRYKNIVEDAVTSAPTSSAAVRTPGGAIEVFARGADNHLVEFWENPGSPWQSSDMGGDFTGTPVTFTNPATGAIEVFARSGSGDLVHKWYDTAGWHAETVGGPITGNPSAFYEPHTGSIEVFATHGTTNHLMEFWKRPQAAWQWSDKGGFVVGSPLAFALPGGGIQVVVRGSDNGLWEQSYTPTGGWDGFGGLGGSIASSPTGFRHPDTGAIEVYARASDGSLSEFWKNVGSEWKSTTLGGAITGTPLAFATRSGGIEIFARSSNGTLAEFYYSAANGWRNGSLGGAISGSPVGYLYDPATDRIDAFAHGANGHLTQFKYTPSAGWSTSDRGGSLALDG